MVGKRHIAGDAAEASSAAQTRESVRLAMDEAWRDHQHTRDQTWKALAMEFALAAGLVGAAWPGDNSYLSTVAGVIILGVAACGIQITLRHRNRVELGKFRHILNCEEYLGLHTPFLISGVREPLPISFWDAFRPRKGNTALFILRMHIAIFLFALAYAASHVYRLTGPWRWLGCGILACMVIGSLMTMFTGESVKPECPEVLDGGGQRVMPGELRGQPLADIWKHHT